MESAYMSFELFDLIKNTLRMMSEIDITLCVEVFWVVMP
jgi:hypothetical protein